MQPVTFRTAAHVGDAASLISAGWNLGLDKRKLLKRSIDPAHSTDVVTAPNVCALGALFPCDSRGD